ncbi:hypothetical protein ATCC90586_003720 [Pythium insidiosum]|nr:hypothetical protein ATCC90586_003720 [Pythium insidiosum]
MPPTEGTEAPCPEDERAALFHDDGFVTLDDAGFRVPAEEVAALRSAILRRYDALLRHAGERGVDLSKPENAETIAGFYVRRGGRVDMQLSPCWGADGKAVEMPRAGHVALEAAAVDVEQLRRLERHWRDVVAAIFKRTPDDGGRAEFFLEYIGCVVARPGDEDQNWHLDGVHRNLRRHEPADRLNVFVPLVDLSEDVGGTEMKKASQFHDDGRRGAAFADYAHLESVTPLVQAGTPVVMDYRVWHRGLANRSETLRPLLYFKYSRHAASLKRSSADESEADADAEEKKKKKKKKKRVALVQVS